MYAFFILSSFLSFVLSFLGFFFGVGGYLFIYFFLVGKDLPSFFLFKTFFFNVSSSLNKKFLKNHNDVSYDNKK